MSNLYIFTPFRIEDTQYNQSNENWSENVSDNDETDNVLIGGISASEYLRKFNKDDTVLQYKRFENLVVPFGLQMNSQLQTNKYNGGELSMNDDNDIISMMSINDYDRMFGLISKDLGHARSTRHNKTKKNTRK